MGVIFGFLHFSGHFSILYQPLIVYLVRRTRRKAAELASKHVKIITFNF